MKRAGSAGLGSLSRNDPPAPWQRAARSTLGLPKRLWLACHLTHGCPVSLGGEGAVRARGPSGNWGPLPCLSTGSSADSAVCRGVEMNLFSLDRWASLVVQMVKNLPAVQETRVRSLGREVPSRREWQPTPVFLPRESERVTGRKAKGLQTEEIGCKCLVKVCVAMTTPGST